MLPGRLVPLGIGRKIRARSRSRASLLRVSPPRTIIDPYFVPVGTLLAGPTCGLGRLQDPVPLGRTTPRAAICCLGEVISGTLCITRTLPATRKRGT